MRIVTFITILFMIYANKVFSCDCAYRPPIDSAVKNAAFIFSGKVIEQVGITVLMEDTAWIILDAPPIGEPFVIDYIKYTLSIDEQFKGVRKRKTIDVYTPAGPAACGYQFLAGHTYIVYGHPIVLSRSSGAKKYGVRTTSCDRTCDFNRAERNDLHRILKKVKPPATK